MSRMRVKKTFCLVCWAREQLKGGKQAEKRKIAGFFALYVMLGGFPSWTPILLARSACKAPNSEEQTCKQSRNTPAHRNLCFVP